jgi:CubicO group peptidase (beta-lactamase class C family)
LREGFTIVWSGWDGELLPNKSKLRLFAPRASESKKPITGMVRCEIDPSKEMTKTVVNWGGHGSYRPTEAGLKAATLTQRLLPGDPRVPIARDKWKLIVTEVESDNPSQLPKVELEYPDGLKKGHIYELIYEAQDPVVMGAGFTAVRDLISALRYGGGTDNPLLVDGKPWAKYTYGFGVSQSGRFLRELTYWGFNADESGRKVFDGIMPHVSGSGMGSFNHRFAQPTRHAAQHDHHDYPADGFPFAYEIQKDPVSGQTDGILRRSLENGTAPLVFHTQSSSEYWNRSGSLVHTDPLGKRDADVPENVRIYFFGGTQHGPCGFPPTFGGGQTMGNPADYKPFLRALLVALHGWNAEGKLPPPSAYPKIKTGELVDWTQEATGFPQIPGVRFPKVIQQPCYLDFGSHWQKERIVDNQPPVPSGDYKVLVPKSDADGNDVGCLPAPEVAVPYATYTSWRLRNRDAGAENELLSLNGSYIPFPVYKSERERKGDPRLSLEERYGSLELYLEKLTALCRKYVSSGYLLEEDVDRVVEIQRQRAGSVFPDKVSTSIYKAIEPYIDNGEISGAVTLVARNGKVISHQAMGVSDLKTGRAMKKDDMFWIASMTKPLVGACAMILADEGKLDIHDELEKYLPEFKDLWMVDEKSGDAMTLKRPSRKITLLDVATHTAGIGGVNEPLSHTTLAELVAMASQRPLEFEPGSRWKYSSMGTHVIGRVVEVVSGKSFDVFLKERILDPLGMKDTTFFPPKEKVGRVAKSYMKNDKVKELTETDIYFVKGDLWDTKRTVKPGGGLFSTAEDLRRFYQMMLNKGVWNGKRILSENAVKELTRTQSGDIKTGFTDGMSWGIKFQVVKEPQGVTAMLNPGTFGHGGAYATQSWADPVNQTIYIMMIQRRGFKNGDASPVRMAFQSAAANALNAQ